MPARVVLKVNSGPLAGKVFVFREHDAWVFGRAPDCHAAVPEDRLVSRRHFLLETNPPEARIRDLGSLNGTFVNGVKLGGRKTGPAPEPAAGAGCWEAALRDGDRIAAGGTTIQVAIQRPATCGACGAELPEGAVEQGEVDRPDRSDRTAPLDGPRCGEDGAVGAGEATAADRLCPKCRSEVLIEQRGGLRQLLERAARSAARRQKPQIPGYDLGAILGKGGMGVVYRAARKEDGQPAAVKVILAAVGIREEMRKRFLREIEVALRLRHRHIVRGLAGGAAGDAFYFIMEYCNAGSLATLKEERPGGLALPIAAPIMLQCLSGLQYAHEQALVHRDIKPTNILFDRRRGGLVAKIADFGLAKNFENAGLSGMTATGSTAGSYHWMPREQLTDFKYARPTNDVWSAAATFYYLLTGQYPRDFPPDRDPIEVVLEEEAVEIRKRDPMIPAELAGVLDRALAADPNERYQDAAQMREALARALDPRRIGSTES